MLDWDRAEKVVAEAFGAKLQPLSGRCSVSLYKGDAVTEEHLIEVKSKRKSDRYRLHRQTLVDLRTRAARIGRLPIIAVVFEGRGCLIIVYADADEALAALGDKKCQTVNSSPIAPWKRKVI